MSAPQISFPPDQEQEFFEPNNFNEEEDYLRDAPHIGEYLFQGEMISLLEQIPDPPKFEPKDKTETKKKKYGILEFIKNPSNPKKFTEKATIDAMNNLGLKEEHLCEPKHLKNIVNERERILHPSSKKKKNKFVLSKKVKKRQIAAKKKYDQQMTENIKKAQHNRAEMEKKLNQEKVKVLTKWGDIDKRRQESQEKRLEVIRKRRIEREARLEKIQQEKEKKRVEMTNLSFAMNCSVRQNNMFLSRRAHNPMN